MFDLRYHVASLAAVFLALIIGILVGVGFANHGFVSKTERKILNDEIDKQKSLAASAQNQVIQLQQSQRGAQEYITRTYPTLMKGRLAGRQIALVSVGPMNSGVASAVKTALTDAGAPPTLRIRAIRVPVDDKALDDALAGRPALGRYVGKNRLPDLGRALGQELVRGGKTPLWDALVGQLVEERIGRDKPPAAGVVVMRSVKPQQDGTARFLGGFYSGLATAGAPAVGVETATTTPSAVPAFKRGGLSTVDSIDTAAGRLALVLLLAGGQPGHYGLRKSATDGVLPQLRLVPATTTTTGG